MKIETEEIEIEEWKPELSILQSTSENEIRNAKVTLSNGSPCSSENQICKETYNAHEKCSSSINLESS